MVRVDRLENAGRWDLLERIEDALDALAGDPGSGDNRKRVPDDDWLIIWEHDQDVIAVRYIGPDPFA